MARPASIAQREFGTLPGGQVVHEYVLDNGNGMALHAINLGGIVTALHVPDRRGRSANVVLGFAALSDYVERNPHFGTLVGRCANRIAGGRFMLDGEWHRLVRNDGANTLHGGASGFGTRWWHATAVAPDAQGSVALQLAYTSAEGEEGFPGRLDAGVRYTLTPSNEWRIDYRATCSRATVVNLTHHDYFNLAGSGSALAHRLTLQASQFAAINRELIPTALQSVAGTPFDFRLPTGIDERIRANHEQLRLAQGYDHSFALDRPGPGLHFAARLQDDASGRVLEIDTTEPAMQFYSGNFLGGGLAGSGGQLYRQGDGICLEPQQHPDAPNRPDFPSVVLRPDEVYTSRSVYRFRVT